MMVCPYCTDLCNKPDLCSHGTPHKHNDSCDVICVNTPIPQPGICIQVIEEFITVDEMEI